MADTAVPHFRNDAGVKEIFIGARQFMCTGASHPYDHPHIFLDMGGEDDTICPYCSTRYRYDEALAAGEARPAECAYGPGETV